MIELGAVVCWGGEWDSCFARWEKGGKKRMAVGLRVGKREGWWIWNGLWGLLCLGDGMGWDGIEGGRRRRGEGGMDIWRGEFVM